MALDKDAKHDFYSIAAGDLDTAEGLRSSELWAEANFILPAGEFMVHLRGVFPILDCSLGQSASCPSKPTRVPFTNDFMMRTGGTTLSAALSAIFFYLSRNPAVYSRLAAEIRTAFTSGRAIQSGHRLKGLKYLRAVIDESMRMSPPFVGTLWREPYSSYRERFVVDGHVIPPGTIVGVNPYCVMHNEAYFPEPFSFRPERWLDSDVEDSSIAVPDAEGEQARSMMRAAFATFAFGETGCVGKAMAYQEMSLVVAKTLWYFDFETASGEAGRLGEGKPGKADGRGRKDEYQLFDMAVADHDGPNLVFRPRNQYWQDLGVTADEG